MIKIKSKFSLSNYYYLLQEAIADIEKAEGENLTNIISKLLLRLKTFKEDEDNEKDITKMFLYYAKKIKPESKKYFDKFENDKRKIFLIKNFSDNHFVGTTDDNKNIVINFRKLNNFDILKIEDFKHELSHAIQYLEILGNQNVGQEKMPKTFNTNEDILSDQNKMASYLINSYEIEKSISMYISRIKKMNIHKVSYKKAFDGIFNEYINDNKHNKIFANNVLDSLYKNNYLKKKILKRLYREGILVQTS
jgi:hypothetical protein